MTRRGETARGSLPRVRQVDPTRLGLEASLLAMVVVPALLHGGVELWVQTLVLGLLLAAGLFWCLGSWQRRQWALYRSPLDLPTLALVAVTAVTAFLSVFPYPARLRLHLVVGYALFYLLWIQAVRRRHQLLRMVWVLVLFGALYAGLALVVSGSALLGLTVFSVQGRRLSLTFANPDHFASYLSMLALLALGLALAHRGAKRWLLLCLSLLMQVAVVFSASRGGIASLVAGLLLLLGLSLVMNGSKDDGRGRTGWVALTCLPLLVAGLVAVMGPSPVLKRFESLTEAGPSVLTRPEIWSRTLLMIRDHPWLGTGPGSFQDAFPPYQSERLAGQVVNHAHNDYLELAAESGLVGLAIGVVWGLVFFTWVPRRLARVEDQRMQSIGLGALAASAAMAVHALVDFNLAIPSNALLFLASAASAVGCVLLGSGRQRRPTWLRKPMGNVGRAVLPVVGPLLALAGLGLLLPPLSAEGRLEEGRRLLYLGHHELARSSLRQAHSRFPSDPRPLGDLANITLLYALPNPSAGSRQAGLLDALGLYDLAIDSAPLTARYHRDRAAVLHALNRPLDAEQALRQSLDLAPTSGAAHNALGNFLLDTGREREALIELRHAIRLENGLLRPVIAGLMELGYDYESLEGVVPVQPAARLGFSELLFERDDPDHALRELTLATRLSPSADTAKAHLEGLTRAHRLEEALPLAEAYHERFPDSRELTITVIGVLLKMDRPEAAAALIQPLIDAEPDNPALYAALGRTSRQSNSCTETLAVLTRAAARVRDPRVVLELGFCYAELGSTHRALQAFEAGAVLAPYDARFRYLAAGQLRHLGQNRRALLEYQRCLEIEPGHLGCSAGLQSLTLARGVPLE